MASNLRTVFELAKAAPNAVRHHELFNQYARQQLVYVDDDGKTRRRNGDENQGVYGRTRSHGSINEPKLNIRETRTNQLMLDLLDWERSLITTTEMNLISMINTPDKWVMNGFSLECPFILRTSASTTAGGMGRLEHKKKVMLSFKSQKDWWLEASPSELNMATRSDAALARDEMCRANILESIQNPSISDVMALPFSLIIEKASQPQNLVHIFTKMYLYLMDYNLAVTSRSQEKMIADMPDFTLPNLRGTERLGVVTDHSIVIDSKGFTPQELGFINLAAAEYPTVCCAGDDNIYTRCNMAEDDLRIISSGEIPIDFSLNWGSPDNLYNLITAIACKFDALDCLHEAFFNMRGRCGLMREVLEYTECSYVMAPFCLSRSIKHAFGNNTQWGVAPKRHAGFLSTSISLVSDLLLGQITDLATTLVGEEMGAFGELVTKGMLVNSKTFSSLVRDWGIHNAQPSLNMLLIVWNRTLGQDVRWAFGRMLGEYFRGRNQVVRDKHDSPLVPLLHALPAVGCLSTALAMSRGWQGVIRPWEDNSKNRDANLRATAAFTWMMGVRETRPLVGHNELRKKEVSLGFVEMEFLAATRGRYQLEDVSLSLGQEAGGREDANEVIATNFYKTEFAGVRGHVIYDQDEQRWSIKVYQPEVHDYRQSIGASLPTEPVVPASQREVPRKAIVPRFASKPTAVQTFDKISQLPLPKKATVSRKPKHVRSDSSGNAVVGEYHRSDGITSNRYISLSEIPSGETDVKMTTVSTKGDGKSSLHAIVTDLMIKGMIGEEDANKVFSDMNGMLDKTLWNTDSELGGLVQNLGFKLDIVHSTEDTVVVDRFGKKEDPTITLWKGEDGVFSAVLLGDGYDVAISEIREMNVPEDTLNKGKLITKYFRIEA